MPTLPLIVQPEWFKTAHAPNEPTARKRQAEETLSIDVVHEIGSDLEPSTITETRVIRPSIRPVRVHLKSRVVTAGIQGLRSPQYLAAIRRRSAKQIATSVAELERQSSREDFAVCTYPIVKRINELLAALVEGNQEGNTREVLRLVRNTFMNGGWSQYRKDDVRRLCIDILNELADAEEVLPKHASESFSRLFDARLNPVGASIPPHDQDDSAHGQEEISH